MQKNKNTNCFSSLQIPETVKFSWRGPFSKAANTFTFEFEQKKHLQVGHIEFVM